VPSMARRMALRVSDPRAGNSVSQDMATPLLENKYGERYPCRGGDRH
jgi:hypothetical protein